MSLPAADRLFDPDCVFCRIVAGQIPCHRVYEDDFALAFLDIQPLSRGHLLLIPRAHYEHVHEMPADLAARVFGLIPMLADRLVRRLGVSAYNILQNNGAMAGQAVRHVHVHLIPRSEDDALGFRWRAGNLSAPDAAQLLSLLA